MKTREIPSYKAINLAPFGSRTLVPHAVYGERSTNYGVPMKFEGKNCQVVKQAVQNKKNIDFEADKSVTIFAGSEAPDDWNEYPPSILSDFDLAKVKAILAIDTSIRGALHRLEQSAHEQGAKVYYKALDDDTISIRIEW